MTTIEQTTYEMPFVDYVGQRSYDDLLQYAKTIAIQNNFDDIFVNTTFNILEELKLHDEDVAIGGLRTMPIALEIADEISGFYDKNIDKSFVFGGAILHDIGKLAIHKELLQKSTAGCEWTESDKIAMQEHVVAGGSILRKQGFPSVIIRAVEEHHNKQVGGFEYGIDTYLTNDERICRDAIAIADFEEADINRTNTRNRGLSREQREQEVAEDVAYVLNDYVDSMLLTERVIKRSLG